METRTSKYILENQLASYMNNTKWKELISEITSISGYQPLVNIKLIFDTENNNSFSPVWWNEVEKNGFEIIEWMQIQSIKVESLGRLIQPRKTDFTDLLKKGLDKHSIEYEYENNIFTVYGYKRLN